MLACGGAGFQQAQKLVVVDFGLGMAAALIADAFAALGAQVVRAEPPLGDPFYEVYPAYGHWRRRSSLTPLEKALGFLPKADVCIIGGEAFPECFWAFDGEKLSQEHSRLVVLKLDGYIGEEGAEMPAVDLLAQARSGLCFEQFSTRPLAWAYPAPTYGATLHGLIAVWAALVARARTGTGQVVSTSLQRGAGFTCMPDRIDVARHDRASIAKIPLDVRQLIFACSDGKYVQFAMQRPGALARAYKAFGIDDAVDAQAAGHKQLEADPRDFFGDYELFARHAPKYERDELLRRLWREGVAAAPVSLPGDCWSDPQVAHNDIIDRDVEGAAYVRNPLRLARIPSENVAAARPGNTQSLEAPLTGKKVVGFGTFIAGPYASRTLADLGAEVIKIDSPGGDPNQNVYSAWAMCNAGKKSLVVDLKKPEGVEIVRRLCSSADIVHHNFRPGVASRLGIAPTDLRREKPTLITLETSAYGSSGPMAESAGLDPILQAICGHETRAGGQNEIPLWYRTAVVDYATGALGTISMLIALYEQSSSDDAPAFELETNLLDAGLYLMSELVQRPEGVFVGATFNKFGMLGSHPAERIYQVSDGWIAVVARSNKMAADFARAIGVEAPARSEWDERVSKLLQDRLLLLSRAQAMSQMKKAGVWCEECLRITAEEFPNHTDTIAARMCVEYDDAHYGRTTMTSSLFELSKSALPGPGRIPKFGEHTRQILQSLDYSDGEIDRFYADQIVF